MARNHSYCLHKSSGHAYTKITGNVIWLGKFGAPESKEKFHRVLTDFYRTGKLPEPTTISSPQKDDKPSISYLVSEHRKHAERRYVKHGRTTTEVKAFQVSVRPLWQMFGTMATGDFGPLALQKCRDALVAKGFCRVQVNKHVGRIKRVFKWGVSREIVSQATYQALLTVEDLRKGEGAWDPPPVGCVPEEHIEAIRPHVAPTIWAMIQLQLWSAARPGEVCNIRTCDVRDDSDLIPVSVAGLAWLYSPGSHKREHHDLERWVLFGPRAQAILAAWFKPAEPEAYIFSPRESREAHLRTVKAKRKTPRFPSSNRPRKASPKRAPGERYTTITYGGAIAQACEKAGIPRWSPNRLRHNAATRLRKLHGAEVAQILLGHTNLKVTEIYAERDLERAVKAIAQSG